MQEFIAAFGLSPLGPMALAFISGVAFGWFVRGGRLRRGDEGAGGANRESKEIVVIKAELDAARALLDEKDGEGDAIAEQLSSVDDAVKRANGRLKLILAAVKRAARVG
ncbi:MAG: hypothetical protein R3C42_03325 [Parvularculaceae bacterium]|nr:hypothetical protein [Parvularculaceae bacterium]